MGILRILKEVMWGDPAKEEYVFAYVDNPSIKELVDSKKDIEARFKHYNSESLTSPEKANLFKTGKIGKTTVIKVKNNSKEDKEIEH